MRSQDCHFLRSYYENHVLECSLSLLLARLLPRSDTALCNHQRTEQLCRSDSYLSVNQCVCQQPPLCAPPLHIFVEEPYVAASLRCACTCIFLLTSSAFTLQCSALEPARPSLRAFCKKVPMLHFHANVGRVISDNVSEDPKKHTRDCPHIRCLRVSQRLFATTILCK